MKVSGQPDFTGESSVNGEYHYKNSDTREIYSDAHYIPLGESTDPPKYYTPAPRKEPEEGRTGLSRTAITVVLCAVFAVLGCVAGAGMVSKRTEPYIEELESVFVHVPITRIPWYPDEVRGMSAVKKLSLGNLPSQGLFDLPERTEREIYVSLPEGYQLMIPLPGADHMNITVKKYMLDLDILPAGSLVPGGDDIEDCDSFVQAIGIAMD